MIDGPADFQEFRTRREAELVEPYGWLTLCGFHWLPLEPTVLPGLPGRWWTEPSQHSAFVEATAADSLLRGGAPIDGVDSFTAPEYARLLWVEHEQMQVELLRRGGRLAIRMRTETSAARTAFTHVPTFPYDPAWRLPARFAAYAEARDIVVDTIRPDLQQVAHPLGEVVFEAGGVVQRLAVTKGKYGWGVEFHDPTNVGHRPLATAGGVDLADDTLAATTERWRQLHFEPPAEGSDAVLLDFNRATNMWFAFTDHATCPAPIAGNVVTVAVPAGERRIRPTV